MFAKSKQIQTHGHRVIAVYLVFTVALSKGEIPSGFPELQLTRCWRSATEVNTHWVFSLIFVQWDIPSSWFPNTSTSDLTALMYSWNICADIHVQCWMDLISPCHKAVWNQCLLIWMRLSQQCYNEGLEAGLSALTDYLCAKAMCLICTVSCAE